MDTAISDYFLIREKIIGTTGFCFIPRVSDKRGNSCIANLTLWKNEVQVMALSSERFDEISPDADNFICGILTHLDSVLHFLAPSHNSLKRFEPKQEVGVY